MDLFTQVKQYIKQHGLLNHEARVVVGVSGGPDSVALLHLLTRLAKPWRLHIHVAHLHHGIRGADADADAEFVAELASDWGWPCTIERVDIPALASAAEPKHADSDLNQERDAALEETARRVRYAFLTQEAQAHSADAIAVGHNANDQAETVLMHLLRGAGPAGLRGMLPRAPIPLHQPKSPPPAHLALIRPLLSTSREAIEVYCETHDLKTRLDPTNLNPAYFRNQVRHHVLPYLEDVRPGIHERLTDLAEIIRADYALWEEFVQVAWDTLLIDSYPDALIFNLEGWRAQPLSVQRALIRRAACKIRGTRRDLSFHHVENAVYIGQQDHTGAQATLPDGLILRVGYTTLTVADQEACHLPSERPWLAPGDPIQINLADVTADPTETNQESPIGKTYLPAHTQTDASHPWVLITELMKHWHYGQITHNSNPLTAWMDADRVDEMLVHTSYLYLRTRKPGDRFHPQGLGGATVRLSDLFINAKLPRAWRDHLPLLTTDDEILWVVGIRLSQCVRVRPESKRVLRLRFLQHDTRAKTQTGDKKKEGKFG
jgi:tRNA(Ile)-lysidine synthase